MSKIKTIRINNFKFFGKSEDIVLDGHNLLLYGENGSGKSTIYWALYTLLQCSLKKPADTEKYFLPRSRHEESLVNIYAEEIDDGTNKHHDCYVKIETDDIPVRSFGISLLDQAICTNAQAREANNASDFINYKVLFKFQNFKNSEEADLAPIFIDHILPYITFPPFSIKGKTLSNVIDMWREFKDGPGTTTNHKRATIQVYKNSQAFRDFERFVAHFNSEFEKLMDFINLEGQRILNDLGYDITFKLRYVAPWYHKRDKWFDCGEFKIILELTSYYGQSVSITRPQTFLNEAKLSAIALAIRLAILNRRISGQAPETLKFIVLDDILISQDMNNRDKVVDYILSDKFIPNIQLLFLTHDKNLYNFVTHKITHKSGTGKWIYKEMYVAANNDKTEYPVIIDENLEPLEKARSFFKAHDYESCGLYIRKELERLVGARLPEELKRKIDGSYLPLQTLWERMVERYSILGIPINHDMGRLFNQTKLLILNPQAHYQKMSLPVYRNELQSAFHLVDLLSKTLAPTTHLLIAKETVLVFTHPKENYTVEFELTDDLAINRLKTETDPIKNPETRLLKWQYNGTEFWDFSTSAVKEPAEPIKQKIKKLKQFVINRPGVEITGDLFDKNTVIKDTGDNLYHIISSVGITID